MVFSIPEALLEVDFADICDNKEAETLSFGAFKALVKGADPNACEKEMFKFFEKHASSFDFEFEVRIQG